MIRKIIHALTILGLSTSALGSSPYDYNGQELGLYFGHAQWKVGFDQNRGHDVPKTCVAVLTAGETYYRKLKDAKTSYSYHRAAISLAQAWHFNQTEKTDWIDQYIFDAGDAYSDAIINEKEFPNSQSWKDYKLTLNDLLRNVAKCERLYPNQSRAATASDEQPAVETPEPTIIQPIIPPKPPAKTYTEQESLIHGCAVVYDAYVRTLVEQSFADKSVTIDIRADRDPVWRKLRGRSIDAWAFGVPEKSYELPSEIKDGAKSMSQDALRDTGKLAELKTNIGVCDSLMKLPTIPLGY
jgi:hypothetical protein